MLLRVAQAFSLCGHSFTAGHDRCAFTSRDENRRFPTRAPR